MAFRPFNLDLALNQARSVIRGEVPGSVRLVALGMLTLLVWVLVSWAGGWTQAASSALQIQEGRWRTLGLLASEYRALAPQARDRSGEVDVPTVFAQISELMALGSRVNRISPDGRNQSVEVNRLYPEELEELIRELASRGVRFLSAEVRALPAGAERLLTVSAIIGPAEGREADR